MQDFFFLIYLFLDNFLIISVKSRSSNINVPTSLFTGIKTIPAHHLAPVKSTAKAKKQFAAAAAAAAAASAAQSGVNAAMYSSGQLIGQPTNSHKSGVHMQQLQTNPIGKQTPSQQLQQQQRTVPVAANNVYIQSGGVQRVSKNSKYLMQQQQLQQQQQHQPNTTTVFQTSAIVQQTTQPHPSGQQLHAKLSNHPQHNYQPMPMQQQQQQLHQQPTMHLTTGASGGTIKYVNAQGTVIAPPNRIRAILQQSTSSQPQQQMQTTTSYYTTSNHPASGSSELMSPVGTNSSESMHSPSTGYSNAPTSSAASEDLPSEEMSARILQSLSQTKTMFNNNNSNHNNNNTMGRHPQIGTTVVHQPHPTQQQQMHKPPGTGYSNANQLLPTQSQPTQQQQKIVYITNSSGDFSQQHQQQQQTSQMISQQQQLYHQQQQQSQYQSIPTQVQYINRSSVGGSSTITPASGDVVDGAAVSNNFLPAYFNVK